LDLDRFKQVNDTLGHLAGDALLTEVAGRLKSLLRETDVLARLGGDEFAIIQAGETNQHEAARSLAERTIEMIGRPFHVDGGDITIGTSIGIALAAEHELCVQPVSATPFVVYRLAFRSPRSFAAVD
jgi:diguanylate cyclase (GGDEF)-like protein